MPKESPHELTVARMSIVSGPGATQPAGHLSVSGNLGHRDKGDRPALSTLPFPSTVLCFLSLAHLWRTGTRTEQKTKRVITNK